MAEQARRGRRDEDRAEHAEDRHNAHPDRHRQQDRARGQEERDDGDRQQHHAGEVRCSPRRVRRDRRRLSGRVAFGKARAEARDDQQRVVDTQGEPEHRGCAQCDGVELGELEDHRDQPQASDDRARRDGQRHTRGHRTPEHEQQNEDQDRRCDQLARVQRLDRRLVDFAAQRRDAREVSTDRRVHARSDEVLERPDDRVDVATGRDPHVDADRRLPRARPQRLHLLGPGTPHRYRASPGAAPERCGKPGALAIDLARGPDQEDDQLLVEAPLTHIPPVGGLRAGNEQQRGLHLAFDAAADEPERHDDDDPAHEHPHGVTNGEAGDRCDHPSGLAIRRAGARGHRYSSVDRGAVQKAAGASSTLTRAHRSRHRVRIARKGFAHLEPPA